ncbi:MAG TPA: Rieske 2Fe-2S domain-containing protein [Roseiflexaceae bacterium]|nr:Rieske 2Fe-2S domain-containing protein [Roseiflexaceae bacterium]
MPSFEHQLSEADFQAAAQRLDALVREFEALPSPEVREKVFELLQMVDAVHRAGLGRLVSHLRREGPPGAVERAAADPVVRTLLLLYDLLPAPEVIPLVQVSAQPPPRASRPVFTAIARLEELPDGTMQAFDIDGVQVLVANIAGAVYAVRNNCPGSVAPLHLGSFAPPVVTCPWHNEAYDMRTGQRADGAPGPGLVVLPVTVAEGYIQVAVRPQE